MFLQFSSLGGSLRRPSRSPSPSPSRSRLIKKSLCVPLRCCTADCTINIFIVEGFGTLRFAKLNPSILTISPVEQSMQDFSIKSKSMFKKRLQCQCVVRSQCSKCQCVVPNNVPNVSVWFPMFQMSVCCSQCSKCLCVVPKNWLCGRENVCRTQSISVCFPVPSYR